MNRPPPHASPSDGLTRHSTGLSPAHIELIKLLAAIAVEDYLRESETTEAAQQPDPGEHMEVSP